MRPRARGLTDGDSKVPRHQRPTDSAVKFVRGLSGTHKIVLAVAAIAAVLYSAVTFVIRAELERYERERQKIGRPEFKAYKERVEREMREIKDKLEKLDDRVDRLEARER